MAISTKRVKIDESYHGDFFIGEPIGSHKRSFKRYHPRPPAASPSHRLGIRNLTPKLHSLLSHKCVKLQTANLARTFTGSI